MANYKKHESTGAKWGAGLGVVLNLISQGAKRKSDPSYRFDFGELLASGLGGAGLGAVTGVLPDILEPARHPHHRKTCHSLTAMASIAVGLHKVSKSNLSDIQKGTAYIAGAGYLSHLFLDLDTPKGLPLL
jgi:hypothetical protein